MSDTRQDMGLFEVQKLSEKKRMSLGGSCIDNITEHSVIQTAAM